MSRWTSQFGVGTAEWWEDVAAQEHFHEQVIRAQYQLLNPDITPDICEMCEGTRSTTPSSQVSSPCGHVYHRACLLDWGKMLGTRLGRLVGNTICVATGCEEDLRKFVQVLYDIVNQDIAVAPSQQPTEDGYGPDARGESARDPTSMETIRTDTPVEASPFPILDANNNDLSQIDWNSMELPCLPAEFLQTYPKIIEVCRRYNIYPNHIMSEGFLRSDNDSWAKAEQIATDALKMIKGFHLGNVIDKWAEFRRVSQALPGQPPKKIKPASQQPIRHQIRFLTVRSG